ncbi:acyl-CoA synthetase/AMP-acid ligase [Caldisphaera lagunensis DSM 15908]|uniref:Acyl-CoA synthetase/AMP-acid ligase n=1 Tax=Caldisphaera lagunensis (strain DSM 15908 / JCM 11604 / ANMR 0165 / IC-154) TaxID=1056495 RepID=L0ADW3_CALLD|nr:AMP-binding protein [Caldisphaera lagunensis]AFZ71240.1 acyl-CoA synthetase/AMP-acid ligase [Caldisphaera lagunensis DSM 15908]
MNKDIFDIRKFGNKLSDIKQNFQWPDDFNLPKTIDSNEGVAIIEGDKVFSYQYLKEKSNGIAKFLDDLNIKKEEVVGGIMQQSFNLISSILGTYKKGAIFMSISTLLGIDSIKLRLEKTNTKVIFSDSNQIKKLREAKNDLIIVSDDGGDYDINEIKRVSNYDFKIEKSKPSHLLFTSGSTGEPKGALLPHSWILGILPSFQISLEFPSKENDVFMTPIEWAWIGGLGNMALPSLYLGIPLVVYKREKKLDVYDLLSKYEKYRITGTVLVPSALRMIMKIGNEINKYDLKIRSILTGSELVTKDIYDWGEKLGISINNTYGQTETGLITCESSLIMNKKINTVGVPCPGHDIIIVDDNYNVLSNNEVGEIALRLPDPGVMIGYYKSIEATQKKIIDNKIILTGDLGYIDSDGYLIFIGRKDEIIKVSGYRINPIEIENVINSIPYVKESAVIGIEDKEKGMKIVAFVVLKEGVEKSDNIKDEIKSYVKSRFALYAYPSIIEFVDSLPTTTTGKIRRNELKQWLLNKK